jgi:hypothetical protein
MFILNVRTAWNDYFPSTSTTILNPQTYNSRQTPSNTGVYVSNCLFTSITTSSAGGALYFSTSTQYLLVESTSFFSCKTSSNAGAIFFTNTNNGQCVLYAVCGYDCCTTSGYNTHFTYIRVYNTVSSKNYVNYSSISRCVSVNTYYTLELGCGNVCCPSINMSMNKCCGRTEIFCWPTSDSNSVTCSLTYSSFADNDAVYYTCVFLWQSNTNFEMKSCNIIRNTQPLGNGEGTIATCGTLTIQDSCILENKATNTFYGSITLSYSTVDSTSNNGYLTIQNTVTKSFILALNHMSTHNCHSKYDSAGYLTPVIQTPSSSKKQRPYCSCERLFIWCPQVNFISLSSVFIFNFIHPSSSIDFFY